MLRRISIKAASLTPKKKIAASLIATTTTTTTTTEQDSDDRFRDQRKRRRLDVFPRIDKRQLLFCIPVFILLVLLSQLHRWNLMVRVKNRRRRRRNHIRVVQVKQQLTKPHRQLHSDWEQEYVEAREANMSFQLPTSWTVREHYSQQQEHPHNNIIMPQWLRRYVEFHKQHVFWKEDTQAWAIYDTTRYMKYSWCQKPTTFVGRLWRSLSQLDSSSEECQTGLDVVRNMDGLLTALYVAMMTDRVLIIEDATLTTPLRPFLEENLIHWNIAQPTHDSKVAVLPTVKGEDLCQNNLADTRGIVLFAKEWLGGRKDLWNHHCMNDFRDRELLEKSFDNVDHVDLYQWGFWALFRVKEAVLDDADAFRRGAGLAQGQQRLVDGESHSTFQPYYYAGSSPDPAEEEGTLRCSQRLYQISLPLAANTQEHSYNDDDAIDDDIKRRLNQKVLRRSLVLGVHVSQTRAKQPFIATVIPLQNTLENTPKSWFLSGTTDDDSHRPELTIHEERGHEDPRKQSSNLLWYRHFWTELVVSIEAECIIQPLQPNQKESNRDPSYPGSTMLLVLAQRLSLSPALIGQSWQGSHSPKTKRRCFARTDNCGSDNPSSEALLSMLVDTLPWTRHIAGSKVQTSWS
jgi:hypothetical protein